MNNVQRENSHRYIFASRYPHYSTLTITVSVREKILYNDYVPSTKGLRVKMAIVARFVLLGKVSQFDDIQSKNYLVTYAWRKKQKALA